MRLASIKDGLDGKLVVVSDDLERATLVPEICTTFQQAIDQWALVEPALLARSTELNAGKLKTAFSFRFEDADAPLPRAYQWCEGSVYLVHLERTRKSTNRELPAEMYLEPGVWQGVSNFFVPPLDPILVFDDTWDIDIEPSVAVITDDVPMGTKGSHALQHVKLVVLLNDVSLRAIQIPEMKKGLGIIQGKPMKTFAPVAITPTGLGKFWTGRMLARPVVVSVNGEIIGRPEAHIDANFDFAQLIEYVARTRVIGSGTIISCGTVANRDEVRGSACLMEKRAVEILTKGHASTPYLKFGDRVRIECFDDAGRSLFGPMNHVIEKAREAAAT